MTREKYAAETFPNTTLTVQLMLQFARMCKCMWLLLWPGHGYDVIQSSPTQMAVSCRTFCHGSFCCKYIY